MLWEQSIRIRNRDLDAFKILYSGKGHQPVMRTVLTVCPTFGMLHGAMQYVHIPRDDMHM